MASPNLMSLKPIMISCQILCVLPINKNFETSKLMLFYYVTMNVFFLSMDTLYKLSENNIRSIQEQANLIITIMAATEQILGFIMIISHCFSLVFRKNRLLELIKGLNLLESRAASDGVLAKQFPIIHIIFLSVLMAWTFLCFELGMDVSYYLVAMLARMIFGFLLSASFSTFVDYMRTHLDSMADSLQPNAKKLSLQIDTALYIFDLCRLINRIYSVQILVVCFRILINVILYTNCLILLPWSSPNSLAAENFFFIALLVEEMYSLHCICGSCSNLHKAAENFSDKLFNLMRQNDDLCSNDKLYLYVTMKQTVHFTACGFFSIEYPLVTSIVAAATTYLVILVQFNSPT